MEHVLDNAVRILFVTIPRKPLQHDVVGDSIRSVTRCDLHSLVHAEKCVLEAVSASSETCQHAVVPHLAHDGHVLRLQLRKDFVKLSRGVLAIWLQDSLHRVEGLKASVDCALAHELQHVPGALSVLVLREALQDAVEGLCVGNEPLDVVHAVDGASCALEIPRERHVLRQAVVGLGHRAQAVGRHHFQDSHGAVAGSAPCLGGNQRMVAVLRRPQLHLLHERQEIFNCPWRSRLREGVQQGVASVEIDCTSGVLHFLQRHFEGAVLAKQISEDFLVRPGAGCKHRLQNPLAVSRAVLFGHEEVPRLAQGFQPGIDHLERDSFRFQHALCALRRHDELVVGLWGCPDPHVFKPLETLKPLRQIPVEAERQLHQSAHSQATAAHQTPSNQLFRHHFQGLPINGAQTGLQTLRQWQQV
mmetsp:Transcript_4361/g.17141  ORF Transcript_4361/g.17141 Transcript_4361/m.17141 type:complete len:416 (-) Transcript_4361:121-1368(-)